MFSDSYYAELRRTITCPRCGTPASRDEVDNGVGIICGPFGCPCGWSEDEEYDVSSRSEARRARLRTGPVGRGDTAAGRGKRDQEVIG